MWMTAQAAHARSVRSCPRGRQLGLSIIELLVGVAVGLFVVGGATKLFVDYLGDSRRALVETRVNQDMRVVSDLVVRDLRRASYWANALSGGTYPAAINPYHSMTPTTAAAAGADYKYETGAISAFRLFVDPQSSVGVVQGFVAGDWQPLTDPNSINITQFDVTPLVQSVSLGSYCTPVCNAATPNCPSVNVRRFSVVITGQARSDPRVVRQIREMVRVRNDEIPSPTCP